MSKIGIDDRLYMSVEGNSVEVSEYTVPNGSKLVINRLGGNAALSSEVKVEIKFDTAVLFSTHGDDNQEASIACQGDGAKKVAIRLVNDSASAETIGGHWKGYLVE